MSGKLKIVVLSVALLAGMAVLAQAQHSGHGSPGAPAGGAQTPASRELNAINEKMHKDMAIKFTGDADADFVRGMIPHHQGAVDMAKVLLKYGKDPEIKKLAGDIVKSQESEIAFMRDWLKKRGH